MKISFLLCVSFLIFVSCTEQIKLQSSVYMCTYSSECPPGMLCAGYAQMSVPTPPGVNPLTRGLWGLCLVPSDLSSDYANVEICDNNVKDVATDTAADCDNPKCNVPCYIDGDEMDVKKTVCSTSIDEFTNHIPIKGPCDDNTNNFNCGDNILEGSELCDGTAFAGNFSVCR
jgi:hypothetical protein